MNEKTRENLGRLITGLQVIVFITAIALMVRAEYFTKTPFGFGIWVSGMFFLLWVEGIVREEYNVRGTCVRKNDEPRKYNQIKYIYLVITIILFTISIAL